MDQGTLALQNETIFRGDATYQTFLLPLKEPELCTQVYWTDQDIPEHEPVFLDAVDQTLRPEFGRWGDKITKRVDDLKAYRLVKPLLVPQTEEHMKYEVWARLKLNVEGLNVSVDWEIAPPKWRPPRKGECNELVSPNDTS